MDDVFLQLDNSTEYIRVSASLRAILRVDEADIGKIIGHLVIVDIEKGIDGIQFTYVSHFY